MKLSKRIALSAKKAAEQFSTPFKKSGLHFSPVKAAIALPIMLFIGFFTSTLGAMLFGMLQGALALAAVAAVAYIGLFMYNLCCGNFPPDDAYEERERQKLRGKESDTRTTHGKRLSYDQNLGRGLDHKATGLATDWYYKDLEMDNSDEDELEMDNSVEDELDTIGYRASPYRTSVYSNRDMRRLLISTRWHDSDMLGGDTQSTHGADGSFGFGYGSGSDSR